MGDVNHICDEQPCRCTGPRTAWDDCGCIYAGFARCMTCGAPMRKIDVDTGDDVVEHCTAVGGIQTDHWEHWFR